MRIKVRGFLLGLSLFSVPVNFAILGGLLYSQFQWDAGLHSYLDFACWSSVFWLLH
jgi:hypothetical protein